MFLGWLLIITAHVAQIWVLWWFFWQYVVGDVDRRQRRSESTMTLGLGASATAAHAAAKGGAALASAMRRSVTANRAKAAACFAAWATWLAIAIVMRRVFKRLMPAMVTNHF